MPRPIDRFMLQRFVEKKRFLKKIKQGVSMRLEVQKKKQILSRGEHYFTPLKTTIHTPKLRILL